jgi:hypothetical protein
VPNGGRSRLAFRQSELFVVPQLIKKKKNQAGIVFPAAGGRRAGESGGSRLCQGHFFMTLQPTEKYQQNLRQHARVRSLSPTTACLFLVW